MDNASIHRANILNKLKLCMRMCYLPPYSPIMNPREEKFWKKSTKIILMNHLKLFYDHVKKDYKKNYSYVTTVKSIII